MPTPSVTSIAFLLLLYVSPSLGRIERDKKEVPRDRDGKFLSMFQIIQFPNSVCSGGTTKNGTCYTSTECTDKKGVSSGTCAQGFGVCCIFTVNCGGTSSENCTYFESLGSEVGGCRTKICKCSSNICQLRLDFNIFVIGGPSTSTISVTTALNGRADAAGTGVTTMSQCMTDTFVALNTRGRNPPTICGTNTGDHMYIDASDACNDLVFQLGTATTATGAAAFTMRQWSIKVTQYDCNYQNLAPPGCTQYHFGSDTGMVQTFNFQGGQHLANQDQSICVRKERGNCQICWNTAAVIDFATSGVNMGRITSCCTYGADNLGANGYDCAVIPGARKTTAAMLPLTRYCGRDGGIVTVMGVNSKTICSTRMPFQIGFMSDNYETAATEGLKTNVGFKLTYTQNTNCQNIG